MHNESPPDELKLTHRAFDALWGRDRAAIADVVGGLLSRLRGYGSVSGDSVDWRQEMEVLTRLAKETARDSSLLRINGSAPPSQALLLWSIAHELALDPTAHKASLLRSLARHSWTLEHSVSRIILLVMAESDATRQAWLALLKAELALAIKVNDDSNRDSGGSAASTWGDAFRPNLSHASIEPFIAPFRVLLHEDPSFSFKYLDSLSDWGLVEHLLLLSGAVATFDLWRIALAHSAAIDDAAGHWSGRLLAFLLMKHAQQELLLAPGEQLLGRHAEAAPWSLQAIAAEVCKRPDGVSLLRAWSVVVFKDYAAFVDSARSNASTRGAHKSQRFEEILQAMPVDVKKPRPSGTLPRGYPAWFAWYERGLECRWHNQSSREGMPTIQTHELYEQAVTWSSQVSADIRNHQAQIGYGQQAMILTTLDFHLAAALVASDDAVQRWQDLWAKTLGLREVVEFGNSPSPDESARWLDRDAATSLTELVVRLGVAAGEIIVQSPSSAPEADGQKLYQLIASLQSAALEMATIELLKASVWTHAIRHVMLLWLKLRSAPEGHVKSRVEERRSHERELVEYLSTDPSDLLLALSACVKNSISEQVLVELLSDAGVNLAACVSLARRFSEMIHPSHRLPQEVLALGDRLVIGLSNDGSSAA